MLSVKSRPGTVAYDSAGYGFMPDEIGLRLLGRAVAAVGTEGPVELAKLEALKTALDAAKNAGKPFRRSLAGAIVTLTGGKSGGKIVVEQAPPRRPVRPKSLTKGRRSRAKRPETR
jgi:tRNA(Ile)-lysidine synthase